MNNYYCLSLHLNSTANEHIATAHTNLIKSSLADNGSLILNQILGSIVVQPCVKEGM